MTQIKRISPAEAHALMDGEGYVYLDVRSEPEFAAGHPKGAINVPLMHAGATGMRPNDRFLEVVSALHPKDAKLVIGCRSGQRSMRAAEMMARAGYTGLVEQRAGFDGSRDAFGTVVEPGWAAAGLPSATATPGTSYTELLAKVASA